MSTTNWVARVIILGSGAPSPIHSTGNVILAGDLSLDQGAELEQLDSPGVNGQRFRERRRMFDPLVVELIEDFATELEALNRESDYQAAEGKLCRYAHKQASVTREWDRATVEDVQIVQRAGKLVGFGAASASKYTLISHWTIRRNLPGTAT